jgi:hypothetical protein
VNTSTAFVLTATFLAQTFLCVNARTRLGVLLDAIKVLRSAQLLALAEQIDEAILDKRVKDPMVLRSLALTLKTKARQQADAEVA